MKNICSLLLIVILAVSVNAQFNAEKTPLITQSLTTADIKSVLAETSGGSITITGVPVNEAKLEVFVVPNNYRENPLSEEEIRQRMKEFYEVKFLAGNNKLTATAKANKNMGWEKSLNFSFKIYVPKNVSADLSTSGGSISLKNLSGTLEFRTSGGVLNVDNVSGRINGRTSGGSISLENSEGDIELSTSGGSINASHCKANLKLHTSGGSLNLEDLDGNISASTSGGSIVGRNISGELVSHTSGGNIQLSDLACSLETSTSGGNIRVSITTFGKYVRISNSSGHIELNLPKGKGLDLDLSADKITTGQLENFSGKMEDDEVKGKLNGGGVPVTVHAGSGKIILGIK